MTRTASYIVILNLMLLSAWWNPAGAWHIIGGELTYEHLGGTTYRIKLKLYRDCFSIGAEFDPIANVGVFGITQFSQLQLPFPGSTHIPITLDDPCLVAPPNVCVEEAVYEQIVTFNFIPESGIILTYQRCCRNTTVVNIFTPADVGATYTTTIYPPAVTGGGNSSPYFTNYPPVAICSGQPLAFDHSATDPDGDQLVYELCAPYQGATSTDPAPAFPPPPPYMTVFFSPPYSVANMIGGNPAMAIDPNTGLITGFPQDVGQFVVGVCVSEFRDGELIGVHRRDFQFNVANCEPVTLARFSSEENTLPPVSDTMQICGQLSVDFLNTSIGDMARVWHFGDPANASDSSTLKNPSYVYPDTGQYEVWLIVNPGTACSDTAVKIVNIRIGVEAAFTAEAQCTHTPLTLTDASVALDGEIVSWNWNFGDGNTGTGPLPTHQYANAGSPNVQLIVATDVGCEDTVVNAIIVHPTTLPDAKPDTFVCDLDTVQLSAGVPGVSFQWSPVYEMNSPNAANPLVSPNVTTTYAVALTNELNCVGRDSVVIQITDTVIATAWPDTVVCTGQPVQVFAEGGVYYQWQPANEVFYKLSKDGYFVRPLESSSYVVHSFIGSCFDVDTVHVSTIPSPVVQTSESQTINQGDTTLLHVSGADAFVWSPAFSLSDSVSTNPFAFPLNTTSYVVTGTDENGCYDTDTLVVFVTHEHSLFIPNAFSPNGDGYNDFFSFYTKGISRVLSLRIYSRWGETVYDSDSSDGEPWDGTFKGKPAPLGVYVYVVRAETFDGGVLQESGNLTLLR